MPIPATPLVKISVVNSPSKGPPITGRTAVVNPSWALLECRQSTLPTTGLLPDLDLLPTPSRYASRFTITDGTRWTIGNIVITKLTLIDMKYNQTYKNSSIFNWTLVIYYWIFSLFLQYIKNPVDLKVIYLVFWGSFGISNSRPILSSRFYNSETDIIGTI